MQVAVSIPVPSVAVVQPESENVVVKSHVVVVRGATFARRENSDVAEASIAITRQGVRKENDIAGEWSIIRLCCFWTKYDQFLESYIYFCK